MNDKIKKYAEYSDLKMINQMNEQKIFEKDFHYILSDQPATLINNILKDKLIHRSTLYGSKQSFEISYFRDIGLPSRNLERYTDLYCKENEVKDQFLEE